MRTYQETLDFYAIEQSLENNRTSESSEKTRSRLLPAAGGISPVF